MSSAPPRSGDPDVATVGYGTPAGRWVLLATVLGSGMAMLDGTIVNVALPALGRDLDADVAGLQWTVNGYTLTLAAFILLGGAAGDRFGRRRVFLVGVVGFAIASLLCGIAPNVELLVGARALQGVAGALLTPGSLAILQATFEGPERGRAIGAWSGLGGIAAAVGPFLGGWLVDVASWRWVFLINLPVALAVVLVTLRHVPESRDPENVPGSDPWGAGLGVLLLSGATYALVSWGERGAADPATWGAALVAAAAGVLFVLVEQRSRHPMLPPGIFASRLFVAANLVTFVVYAALGAVFFLLVLTLQTAVGFGPVLAGAALLPITLIMLALSSRAGELSARIGPRLPMTVGPALSAGGTLLLLRVDEDAGYLRDVLPGVALFGLGLAATVAPLTTTVLAAAPDRHSGLASGVNNAVARTAGLLSVAAVPVLAGLGEAFGDPSAEIASFHRALWWCTGLLVAGSLLSALRVHPDELQRGGESGGPDRGTAGEATGATGARTVAGELPPCRRYCAVESPPLQPSEHRAEHG